MDDVACWLESVESALFSIYARGSSFTTSHDFNDNDGV